VLITSNYQIHIHFPPSPPFIPRFNLAILRLTIRYIFISLLLLPSSPLQLGYQSHERHIDIRLQHLLICILLVKGIMLQCGVYQAICNRMSDICWSRWDTALGQFINDTLCLSKIVSYASLLAATDVSSASWTLCYVYAYAYFYSCSIIDLNCSLEKYHKRKRIA